MAVPLDGGHFRGTTTSWVGIFEPVNLMSWSILGWPGEQENLSDNRLFVSNEHTFLVLEGKVCAEAAHGGAPRVGAKQGKARREVRRDGLNHRPGPALGAVRGDPPLRGAGAVSRRSRLARGRTSHLTVTENGVVNPLRSTDLAGINLVVS